MSRFTKWLDEKRTPNGVVTGMVLILAVVIYGLPGWFEFLAVATAYALLIRDIFVTWRRPRRCAKRFYFGLESLKGHGGLRCWKKAGHEGEHTAGNRAFPVRWGDEV